MTLRLLLIMAVSFAVAVLCRFLLFPAGSPARTVGWLATGVVLVCLVRAGYGLMVRMPEDGDDQSSA